MGKRRHQQHRAKPKPPAGRTHESESISAVAYMPGPVRSGWWGGDKFAGGFGATDIVALDYWTLRARSAQLFETNLYARGLIRRLTTNVIHTGLHLECTPEEAVLGMAEDSLAEWSENVENRFSLWEANPVLCDYAEQRTSGQLQQQMFMESLIEGDVLCVLRTDSRTGLPRVQLIRGGKVQSPGIEPRSGNRIDNGVELDAQDRHVAYWIVQDDGTFKRLPAWGERSGRRIAWLVYGTERRLGQVRGTPMLSLVLQSLKEIDRYRDSTQRKAVINSMLAMFVAKTADKPGTAPMTRGAARGGSVNVGGGVNDLPSRTFQAAELVPGMVMEELQTGETPHAFQTNGTTEAFGVFEEAIIQAVAWANEVPPEIMRLAFSSNYSASQAATNEFKTYLNKVRTNIGSNYSTPIYVEWLLSEIMEGRIQAPDLLASWRDPRQWDTFAAWTACDWAGNIKPAIDQLKLVNAYTAMCEQGFMTRDRASRELTGTKYSKNVQKLARENAALAEANRVLVELERPPAALPASIEDNPDDTQEGQAA